MIDMRKKAATAAVAVLLAGSTMAQPVAAAAVTAGLGAPAAAVQALSSERSRTVPKSEAEALLASLGDAPSGRLWTWVTDTAATTEKVDAWRTSDGHQFASEDEAEAHASSMRPAVEGKTRTLHYWATSDGQEFDSEEDAQDHADAASVTYAPVTREQAYWETSDGQEFSSEADAPAPSTSGTPPTASPSRPRPRRRPISPPSPPSRSSPARRASTRPPTAAPSTPRTPPALTPLPTPSPTMSSPP